MTCYRIYDADIPEYAVAVDRYEGWVHVQEYAAPASVDPADARRIYERVSSEQRELLLLPDSGHVVPVDHGGDRLAEAVVCHLTPLA